MVVTAARNPLVEMGFEDDYAYQTGSYGSSTSHLDVTRYGLGARGIDRIAKTTSVGEGSEATTIQYPLYDAHGNMVATLSKGSGTAYTVSNQRAFEPWGSVFDSSGLSNTPKQGYCASIGHVADSENGLTYMRARYYEPSTGRFISEDPAKDGANWFVYTSNNPINKIDVSGKLADSVILAGYIFVSGLLSMLAQCLTSGDWSWKSMLCGFLNGVITAAGTLKGTLIGALAGGIAGMADAYLTGGNVFAGGFCGALGGGLGGALSVVEAVAERQIVLYSLLSVDEALVIGDAQGISSFLAKNEH